LSIYIINNDVIYRFVSLCLYFGDYTCLHIHVGIRTSYIKSLLNRDFKQACSV